MCGSYCDDVRMEEGRLLYNVFVTVTYSVHKTVWAETESYTQEVSLRPTDNQRKFRPNLYKHTIISQFIVEDQF